MASKPIKMIPTLQFNLTCFVLLLVITISSSEDVNITIPLNKTLTINNKELYGEFVTVTGNSSLSISFTNVSKKVDYIIVQAHSRLLNVTLYNNTLMRQNYVNGTNVGLFGTVKPPDKYFILNENSEDVKLYISVHGYNMSDPIPGGCNMEFPIPISPFMQVKYNQDMIKVDAAPAKDPTDKDCLGKEGTRVTFYRMYLYERDFGEDSYFEGLKNMLTLDRIMENGNEVPVTVAYQQQRRFLSAYPGIGSIYVAVAKRTVTNSYSIYVPTFTYACSPSEECDLLDDYVSQFFCAGLLFTGLFLCFFGHRFFRTEMFIMGMFAGVIITYYLISIWTDLERPALLGASLLSGSFFGAIWILLWWFYGIPVLSVALVTMHVGFIVAGIIYHIAPSGRGLFADDVSFWTVFIFVMICCSITLTTMSYLSNIACCAVLGAYAVVFSIDHYVGSNLKYLVINVMRRAVVKNFKYAILALPYQWADACLTVLWLALAMSGFLLQHYHSRGRAPFPPPPRSINTIPEPLTYGTTNSRVRNRSLRVSNGVEAANERTALLSGVA